MREFKFRVWCKGKSDNPNFNKQKWFDINDIILNKYFPYILNRSHDNFIVQQYTGLKDKNGKEIYEGDILKFDPDIRDLMGGGCIYSNLGHVWIYSLADGVTISYNHPYSEMSNNWSNIVVAAIYQNHPLSYEIVGNIMENPELLK